VFQILVPKFLYFLHLNAVCKTTTTATATTTQQNII